MKKLLLVWVGLSPLLIWAQPHRNLTQADRYVLLGSQNMLNQSYQSALVAFDRAIELERNHWCAFHFRATLYLQGKEYVHALSDLNEAIRINATNPVLFYKRGVANEALGLYPEAEEDYRRALTLAPDYPSASRNLDRMYSELRRDRDRTVKRYRERDLRYYNSEKDRNGTSDRYVDDDYRTVYHRYHRDHLQPRRSRDVYEDDARYSYDTRLETSKGSRISTPSYDRFRREKEEVIASNSTWRNYMVRDIARNEADEVLVDRPEFSRGFVMDQPREAPTNTREMSEPLLDNRNDVSDFAFENDPFDETDKTLAQNDPLPLQGDNINFDPYAGKEKKEVTRGTNNRAMPATPKRRTITYEAKQASANNKTVYIDQVVAGPDYTQIDFQIHGEDESITLPPPRIRLQVNSKTYPLYYGENTQPRTFELKRGYPEYFSLKFQPIPEGVQYIQVIANGSQPSERWNYSFKLIE